MCMTCSTHTPSHPSAADEAWYMSYILGDFSNNLAYRYFQLKGVVVHWFFMWLLNTLYSFILILSYFNIGKLTCEVITLIQVVNILITGSPITRCIPGGLHPLLRRQAEVRTAPLMMAKAVVSAILEVTLQELHCPSGVRFLATHLYCTASRTSELASHLLCQSSCTFVWGFVLHQLL